MNSYQFGTKEFQPVEITRNGDPVTQNIQLSVVTRGLTPDTWDDPDTLAGDIGFFVENLDPGAYYVYAKVTDNPEIPVLLLGSFSVQRG